MPYIIYLLPVWRNEDCSSSILMRTLCNLGCVMIDLTAPTNRIVCFTPIDNQLSGPYSTVCAACKIRILRAGGQSEPTALYV